MDPVTYAMAIWPKGFTRVELSEALQMPGATIELHRLHAIEDTGIRRRHGRRRYIVWRFKPYQLQLPLGDDR